MALQFAFLSLNTLHTSLWFGVFITQTVRHLSRPCSPAQHGPQPGNGGLCQGSSLVLRAATQHLGSSEALTGQQHVGGACHHSQHQQVGAARHGAMRVEPQFLPSICGPLVSR
eukprot:s65_g23.t1